MVLRYLDYWYLNITHPNKPFFIRLCRKIRRHKFVLAGDLFANPHLSKLRYSWVLS